MKSSPIKRPKKGFLPLSIELVAPALKGTVPRDFRLQVFYMDQFPPSPIYTIRAVSNFLKIRGDLFNSRCTTGVDTGLVDTGGK